MGKVSKNRKKSVILIGIIVISIAFLIIVILNGSKDKSITNDRNKAGITEGEKTIEDIKANDYGQQALIENYLSIYENTINNPGMDFIFIEGLFSSKETFDIVVKEIDSYREKGITVQIRNIAINEIEHSNDKYIEEISYDINLEDKNKKVDNKKINVKIEVVNNNGKFSIEKFLK